MKTFAVVKSDSIPSWQPASTNRSSVGTEAVQWNLGCDSALDEATSGKYTILNQSEILQGSTAGNAQLRCNKVDSRQFFRDGMLNLS